MTREEYIVKGMLADFPEVADNTCEDFEFSPCDFVERFCDLLVESQRICELNEWETCDHCRGVNSESCGKCRGLGLQREET